MRVYACTLQIEERHNAETKRYRKRRGRCLPIVRQTDTGDQAGVVAENDEDEKRAEKQKMLPGLLLAENAAEVVIQILYAGLDHILELAGLLAHMARGEQ